jgi:hypothetical protein
MVVPSSEAGRDLHALPGKAQAWITNPANKLSKTTKNHRKFYQYLGTCGTHMEHIVSVLALFHESGERLRC